MRFHGIIFTLVLIVGFLLLDSETLLGADTPKDAPAKEGEKKEKAKLRFTISKETTYVTEPLDKDGRIDYSAALNARLGKGVSKENNANVLIWRVLGPRPEGGREMPPEFFKLQGVEAPPEKGDYFIPLEKYVRDNFKGDQNKQENILYEQMRDVMRSPWKVEDHPEIAIWLEINKKPLALAIEATKRTHYFSPLVPTKSDKGSSGLVGVLLPGVQRCRSIAPALAIRAMRRLDKGDIDGAWQDILACHRLGRLVGSGACLIEAVVGYALEGIASRAELVFLDRGESIAQATRSVRGDLQSLPLLPTASDKIDLGERFIFLDIIMMIDRQGLEYLNFLAQVRSSNPIRLPVDF